jgi:hypothetical protein
MKNTMKTTTTSDFNYLDPNNEKKEKQKSLSPRVRISLAKAISNKIELDTDKILKDTKEGKAYALLNHSDKQFDQLKRQVDTITMNGKDPVSKQDLFEQTVKNTDISSVKDVAQVEAMLCLTKITPEHLQKSRLVHKNDFHYYMKHRVLEY